MKNILFFPGKKYGAFSLIEVVVAVGVFAIASVSVVGILASVGRSVAEVEDADKAARLIGVIQARLQATPFSTISDNLLDASAVTVDFPVYNRNVNANPIVAASQRVLFASEDGAIVAPYASTAVWRQNSPPVSPQADKRARDGLKYFELTLIRNETLNDSDSPDDANAAFLAFNIRVRWPAFLPNGQAVTDNTQKEVLIVPAVITR